MAGKIRPEQLGTAAAITALLKAADAAGARSALGLGALATKSTAGYADLSVTVGGRNLLPNSSFEQGLTGWTPYGVTATASSTQARVGATSAKLTAAAPDWNVRLAAAVAVKPLTTYTVSAWLYVESVAGDAYSGRDLMVVDGGNSSNLVVGSSLTTGHPTGVWTRKTVRLTTSAASTSIYVYLYCPNGTVYWDCVQVEEGDVPTAWRPYTNDTTMARLEAGLGAMATRDTVAATDLSCLVGGRNLVPNSSFEQGLTGWTPSVATATASSTRAMVGTLSARLTVAAAAYNTYLLGTCPAKPLTTYTVTAWLYVESITGDAFSGRELLVADAAEVTNAAGVTGELTTSHPVGVWTRKTQRITTTAACTSLNIRLYCPTGVVHWDCVQVEEGDVPTAWRPYTSDTTMARLEAGLGAQAVMESPGYASGSGGTVTQATSRSTGVTLNKSCGTITLVSAALAAGSAVTFTVTNSTVVATDLVVAEHVAGGTLGAYKVTAHTPASGSFAITVRNLTAGTLTEAPQIRFAVIKTVNA